MSLPIERIFVCGFPGVCGGAETELHHQIILWRRMGVEVHIIPLVSCESEPLLGEMQQLGVVVHRPREWKTLRAGDPIISFCRLGFLDALPQIRRYTRRTIFVNCMSFAFEKERKAVKRGELAMLLYQNDAVRSMVEPELRKLAASASPRFMTFSPYFHAEAFPFIGEREWGYFGCGHISRPDPMKFSSDILHIYDSVRSRVPKWGVFLGCSDAVREKIGRIPSWIRVADDMKAMSQQRFYRLCHIVLQPTELCENWPRVGLEAMYSGSVLVVDRRLGWEQMVEHGKTGWLCENSHDFIAYATLMARDTALREDMAHAAYEHVCKLSSAAAAEESWRAVFAAAATLPA